MVDEADIRARRLLDAQARDPIADGRRRRRLGHRHEVARAARHRRQLDPVEVEHGHGVGAVPGARVIARHAVHRGGARDREPRDLALQRDPVAIAAVHARPHRDALPAEQHGAQARRVLHARVRRVAREHRVDAARQDRRARGECVLVGRPRGQVGHHEPARREPLHRRLRGRRARPGRHRVHAVDALPRPRLPVEEGARERPRLAAPVGSHPAARAVLHQLRTPHESEG
ncbi:hypothetical protein GCM10025877_07540 [Agromyces mangrovi Wang et al. 2018]|nr:hypothetical protein GCM10025877_07540 [Agromyces mangrovi]